MTEAEPRGGERGTGAPRSRSESRPTATVSPRVHEGSQPGPVWSGSAGTAVYDREVTIMDLGKRCRRCGTALSPDADRFTHVLVVHTEHGPRDVPLSMCRPCGSGFSTVRDRDEYARLTYFG